MRLAGRVGLAGPVGRPGRWGWPGRWAWLAELVSGECCRSWQAA